MALVQPSRSPLLARLFENHAKKLVGFVARTLGRADIAEDVTQNAFLRLQQVKDLDKLDNPQAYLYTTARNLVIDDARRAQYHTEYLDQCQISGDDSAAICANTPDRQLAAEREIAIIDAALANLPEDCQRAFLLHRLEGLRYRDIAERMGVSVSSVEKYISRAFLACQKAQARYQTDSELSTGSLAPHPAPTHKASAPKIRQASKPPPN